jgi:hypothetical protein
MPTGERWAYVSLLVEQLEREQSEVKAAKK